MKLIISYKSATTPEQDAVVLAAIELPHVIAQEIAVNMNAARENKILIDLASTQRVAALTIPVGGLR